MSQSTEDREFAPRAEGDSTTPPEAQTWRTESPVPLIDQQAPVAPGETAPDHHVAV